MQFVVTNAIGDDVDDRGQPCAAQAIDVTTRKAGPRFNRRKSYQPRRLSKSAMLFILGHDRFLPSGKKDQTGPPRLPSPADPMAQSKITSSMLRGPPASPSYSSGGIGGGSDFQASGPERMSGFGVTRSEAGIRGASVGGGLLPRAA